MWRNLVHDILEEFASHATDRHAKRDFAYRLRTVQPEERDPWRHMRKLALKRRRLLRARVEVAQSRPPCPTCGANVERLGTTGTPPKYSQWVWRQYASAFWDDVRLDRVLPYQEAKEPDDERHMHPLQLDVIDRAIVLWSNPGDTIFTPFLGVGSEVYGAVMNGRKGIGAELKESYFRQAKRNLEAAAKGGWREPEAKQTSFLKDEDPAPWTDAEAPEM